MKTRLTVLLLALALLLPQVGGAQWARNAALPPSTLLTGLLAHYSLDEQSGTRYDSTSNHLDLAPTNAPGYAAGVIGNAATFVFASAQALTHASSSDFDISNTTGKAFSFWMLHNDVGTYAKFQMSRDKLGNRFYQVLRLASATVATAAVFDDAGANVGTGNLTISPGSWAFYLMWWDPADRKAYLSVNNGTPVVSTALTNAPKTTGACVFEIGGGAFGSTSDMLMDEVAIFDRVPTSTERACLFGSGSPPAYPYSGVCLP